MKFIIQRSLTFSLYLVFWFKFNIVLVANEGPLFKIGDETRPKSAYHTVWFIKFIECSFWMMWFSFKTYQQSTNLTMHHIIGMVDLVLGRASKLDIGWLAQKWALVSTNSGPGLYVHKNKLGSLLKWWGYHIIVSVDIIGPGLDAYINYIGGLAQKWALANTNSGSCIWVLECKRDRLLMVEMY